MKNIIRTIKKIEREIYPGYMQEMQDIKNFSDLQDYCESEIVDIFLLGKSGYLILTPDEVVDIVADAKSILKAFTIIKKYMEGHFFHVDIRYSTIYPIIRLLESKGKIRTKNKNIWFWENEKMIDLEIQII